MYPSSLEGRPRECEGSRSDSLVAVVEDDVPGAAPGSSLFLGLSERKVRSEWNAVSKKTNKNERVCRVHKTENQIKHMCVRITKKEQKRNHSAQR